MSKVKAVLRRPLLPALIRCSCIDCRGGFHRLNEAVATRRLLCTERLVLPGSSLRTANTTWQLCMQRGRPGWCRRCGLAYHAPVECSASTVTCIGIALLTC